MGTSSLKYQRVLLKLSGEALMGDDAYGINTETVARVAKEVKAAHASGLELCLVIGGGNIFRGIAGAAQGMDRAQADYMGMLATVMNALAMQGALQGLGVPATVMSAIPMELVCEPFNRANALDHLAAGRVVIFAAGTGNPFFTTDTGAALRACEMDCDALLKGTQVDGVYSADPKTNPDAERFEQVSYTKVLTDDLKVMDATAIALARENNLPILVFDLGSAGGLGDVVAGKGRYTYVGNPEG